MTARRCRASGALPGLALLSFVDIVFATMAVLLVAFVLNRIERPEAAAAAAPLRPHLLLCDSGGGLAWHRAGEEAPYTVPPHALGWLLEQVSASDTPQRIVFAFGGGCFATYWDLMGEVERAGRRAASGERRPPPVVTPVPLAAGGAEALLASWHTQPWDAAP